MTSGGQGLTSQLYFPEDLNDALLALEPYSQRPNRDTSNEADEIFSTGGGAAVLEVTALDGTYRAAICLVLPEPTTTSGSDGSPRRCRVPGAPNRSWSHRSSDCSASGVSDSADLGPSRGAYGATRQPGACSTSCLATWCSPVRLWRTSSPSRSSPRTRPWASSSLPASWSSTARCNRAGEDGRAACTRAPSCLASPVRTRFRR